MAIGSVVESGLASSGWLELQLHGLLGGILAATSSKPLFFLRKSRVRIRLRAFFFKCFSTS